MKNAYCGTGFQPVLKTQRLIVIFFAPSWQSPSADLSKRMSDHLVMNFRG